MGRYVSTITFEHNDSLKCVARDYESDTDPVLRGYSLDVKLVFESLELDTNFTNVPSLVIQDIKTYLKDNFHCALIVGEDDPQREDLEKLSQLGLAHVKIRPYVSLEKFAEYIFFWIELYLAENNLRLKIKTVEVREHAGRTALFIS